MTIGLILSPLHRACAPVCLLLSLLPVSGPACYLYLLVHGWRHCRRPSRLFTADYGQTPAIASYYAPGRFVVQITPSRLLCL